MSNYSRLILSCIYGRHGFVNFKENGCDISNPCGTPYWSTQGSISPEECVACVCTTWRNFYMNQKSQLILSCFFMAATVIRKSVYHVCVCNTWHVIYISIRTHNHCHSHSHWRLDLTWLAAPSTKEEEEGNGKSCSFPLLISSPLTFHFSPEPFSPRYFFQFQPHLRRNPPWTFSSLSRESSFWDLQADVRSPSLLNHPLG